MFFLISVNLIFLACSMWVLGKNGIDLELKKQVGILSFAAAFFCLLFFLSVFFDFLEDTTSGFRVAFFSNSTLMAITATSVLLLTAHLAIGAVTFRSYLNHRSTNKH